LSKNVAVFVDVANIFYAAKAAGVDIDYVTLLKASSAGRDLVRAYAYTGLDPDNENQRNFHDFLRRHGYKVVSKDIRKYGDGKVKANLDIELVVDMMKTARNLDIAIVVSGDGDFAPAIRAVQEQGVRVEVVSFRGNTSSDLIDVADQFTDITQIAKVEKGSSRSGRRVATEEEEDLSMTEVPEKQSEGTGDGRRRRGGRTRSGEAAAATPTRRAPTRRRAAPAAPDAVVVDGTLVALPGEKLSRARRGAAAESGDDVAAVAALVDVEALDSEAERPEDVAIDEGGEDQSEESRRRRRRRRGGRGRGRGRGREEQAVAGEAGAAGPPEGEAVDEAEEPELLPTPAPRRPAFSFGSVWDSQLGKAPPAAAASAASRPLTEDEEDLEEPAVPEYLLAERRRRETGYGRSGRGGGGGGRGRGGAYAAALDRERFGGGRGSTPVSRFAEPAPRGRDSGPRDSGGRGGRPAGRPFDRPESRGSSSEPWSEVPPEIEAMLRAQLAATGGRRGPARPESRPSVRQPDIEAPTAEAATDAAATGAPATGASAKATRTRRATTPRRTAAKAAAGAAAPEPVAGEAGTAAAPRRRRATANSAAEAAVPAGSAAEPTKRPRRRSTASTADAGADVAAAGDAGVPTTKRRATRRKTTAAD
jgi:uncharacterized LabA/DUF88 family protein